LLRPPIGTSTAAGIARSTGASASLVAEVGATAGGSVQAHVTDTSTSKGARKLDVNAVRSARIPIASAL
jgi:hypothetical protein